MDEFRPHSATAVEGMAPPHEKPAKSPGIRREPGKDTRTRTRSIDVMETSTVKETTMTRFHADAPVSYTHLTLPTTPYV